MSLQRFLLLTLGTAIGFLLALSLLLGYHNATEQMEEIFDAELAQHAKLLSKSLLQSPSDVPLVIDSWHSGREVDEALEEVFGENMERDKTGHAYENKIAFQVWDKHQQLRERSATAPDTALASFVAGYYDVNLHQFKWRVFVFPLNGKGTVMVAHRDDIRSELASEIAINIILPAVLVLPILFFIIHYVIRKATRPLTSLAIEIENRRPDQLHNIAIDRAPQEIKPIIASLNNMMNRVQLAFLQQRRFIADAAHELRTPLAALQIHSDNALNSSGQAQQHSLQQLQEGISRSTHLVEQMLTFSRLEHQAHVKTERSEIDLNAIISRVLSDLNVVAEQQQKQFMVDAEANLKVLANPTQLFALVRNLCDNALRYSPSESHIRIELKSNDSNIILRVSDQGPGISAELRQRVFEPFFRELGHQHCGTGLGLAIVREVVSQLGGEIELSDNQPHGLVVSITLPRSAIPSRAP